MKKIKFDKHGDDKGLLVALDRTNLLFEPKRVFYMFGNNPDANRGNHAHKSCNELLICTSGSCKIMVNDGFQKEIFILNKPDEGLFLPCNLWREIYDFSKDAVLMAIADKLYDENDYIRKYDEFLEYYNITK